MKNKLQIARQLSKQDWFTLTQAWWVLSGFYIGIRLKSYERLIHQSQTKQGIATDKSLIEAEGLARLVYLASRLHLLPMTCLTRSLTLYWMLGKRGVLSQVQIGTQKTETGINIHAWVDVDGHAIGESGNVNEHFTVLKSFENLKSLGYQ